MSQLRVDKFAVVIFQLFEISVTFTTGTEWRVLQFVPFPQFSTVVDVSHTLTVLDWPCTNKPCQILKACFESGMYV